MSNFAVDERTIDAETLFTRKTISTGTKSFTTPAVATPYRRERPKDTVHTDARGIGEVYRTVTPSGLQEARAGQSRQIQRDIKRDLNRANPGEVVNCILAYQVARRMDTRNVDYMVGLLANVADFITVPLQPEVVAAVRSDEPTGVDFDIYYKNAERVVTIARESYPDRPVMGTIPPLSWDDTRRLVDLYLKHEVRAFCLNFDGRTPTAEAQLTDMLSPLATEIGRRDLADDVLVYGVNAHRGRNTGASPALAENFIGLGMGIDVLGGYHIPLQAPPETIEEFVGGPVPDSPERVEIQVFDADEYVHRDCRLANLENHIAGPTGLDVQRLKRQIPGNQNALSRLRALLNAEQMGLAANGLADAIQNQRVVEHITPRDGVGDGTVDMLRGLRDDYDRGSSQSGLSDFL